MAKFTSMTPMLQTGDLRRTIAFYKEILGFELLGLWPDDATPVWCELASGGARLMFMTNDHLGEPQLSGTLYIRTDDVLELHARIADRVEVEWGPEIYDYGMHEFAIKDCNGYRISFGQPVRPDGATPGR
jgi:uncharacterized glyoxalase superfamily protein PhnB